MNQNDARAMVLKAVSLADNRDTRVEAAVILACAGNFPETDRLLHLASGEVINDLLPETKTLIAGCKSLNRGDYENAMRQLQASYDLSDDLDAEFFLGKAFIAAHRWDSAKAILKDLEASKGRIIADEAFPPIIWPLTHYYLAVSFDESGDRARAVDYYSRFLTLWQSGDSNLASVINSKKRMAELQAPRRSKGLLPDAPGTQRSSSRAS